MVRDSFSEHSTLVAISIRWVSFQARASRMVSNRSLAKACMADSFLEASLIIIGDQEVNGGATHTYVTGHDGF